MLIKPRPGLHDPLPDGRTLPTVGTEKLYIVTGLTLDDLQIVDDNGEPIFVPRSRFDVLDNWMPDDWIQEIDEAEGWYRSGPPQCTRRGFFERWHDGKMHERQIFAEVYTRLWQHYQEQLGSQAFVLKR